MLHPLALNYLNYSIKRLLKPFSGLYLGKNNPEINPEEKFGTQCFKIAKINLNCN
jgi:hypothetical protein